MSILVDAYWNVKKQMWSVRSCKTRKVISHKQALNLKDCRFVVNEAGRQRVLKEKRKNVHAFIRGHLVYPPQVIPTKGGCHIRYNPYEMEQFQTREGVAVATADLCFLTVNKDVIAFGVTPIE